MPKKHFLGEIGITRKEFFPIFVLLFNTFTWWYITLVIINGVISDLNLTNVQVLTLWAFYDVSVIGASIVGSILSDKIKRLHFLCFWMILGAVASLLPALFGDITMIHALSICLFLGGSFGLGMPSCLAYFADYTLVDNRGRMSGIIFLSANLSAPLFSILFGMSDLVTISVISIIWRGLGLILFLSLKPEEGITAGMRKDTSLMSVLHDKSFVLYLIAWLMFSFIDQLEGPILEDFFGSEFYRFTITIGPIISSFFALIGGFLCDWIGRKRTVIYGFVTVGLAYALIGIIPRMIISWYFYCIVDGIAWGIFMSTFVLVLWGDLSQHGAREKYYVIGSAPFFLTDFIRRLSTPYVGKISPYATFSLASLFLFLAVLPLLYAPETLPEKKIELRRLRKYVEKAKRVKEKYVRGGAKG